MVLGRWALHATLPRAFIMVALALSLALAGFGCFGAQVTAKQLYEANCGDCHGEKGNRLPIAPLDSKEYLARVGDAGLVAATRDGKGAMPAWGKERGGPLDDVQIQAILHYLKTGETQLVKPASPKAENDALDELTHNPAFLMVLFTVGVIGFLWTMNRVTGH